MSVHMIDCIQLIDELSEELKTSNQWKMASIEYKRGIIKGFELSQKAIQEFNDEFVGD